MIYDILPVNNYKGNGFNNIFDFDFYIDSASQLKVYLFDEDGIKHELKLNVDYSINEIKNDNGSYITFPIDGSSFELLNENQNISLELDLPFCQETQYNNSSLLNLRTLEYSFDYLTRLIQILKRKLELCVKVEECSSITPKELIESINEANNNAQENANKAIEINNSILNIKKDILLSEENVKNAKNEVDLTKNDITQIATDFELSANSKANTTLDNVRACDEFKNNVISWTDFAPDWSKKTDITLSTAYTAESNGYVVGVGSATGNKSVTCTINDVKVISLAVHGASGAKYSEGFTLPVAKGDIYEVTGADAYKYFVPAKGGN